MRHCNTILTALSSRKIQDSFKGNEQRLDLSDVVVFKGAIRGWGYPTRGIPSRRWHRCNLIWFTTDWFRIEGLALPKACLKRTLPALRRFVLPVSNEGHLRCNCNIDYCMIGFVVRTGEFYKLSVAKYRHESWFSKGLGWFKDRIAQGIIVLICMRLLPMKVVLTVENAWMKDYCRRPRFLEWVY